MTNAIASVIIASAQSVAKVFVIGGVGCLAVLYPRKAPFLPRQLVGNVARFTFHTLTIPLIYSTIAIAVTLESVGDYWFVIAGAFIVLGISFVAATALRYLCLTIDTPTKDRDFRALRVAATFPNIVALPILIFPSLCEFPVVHNGYIPHDVNDPDTSSAAYLERQCVAQSTTMIFIYFFSWSLCFWSFGNNSLMQAATEQIQADNGAASARKVTKTVDLNDDAELIYNAESVKSSIEMGSVIVQSTEDDSLSPGDDVDDSLRNATPCAQHRHLSSGVQESDEEVVTLSESEQPSRQLVITASPEEQPHHADGALMRIRIAIKQTTTSAGFLAMVAAFVTACIPPLQEALFEGGGPLRFLGSAMETLGTASSPISTMVVAASLVPPGMRHARDSEGTDPAHTENEGERTPIIVDENPAMTDPNFGGRFEDTDYMSRGMNRRRDSRFRDFGRSLRSGSIRMLQAVPRSTPDMMRLNFWFCLSRLIVTPAVVVGLILALDCSGNAGGLLQDVPNLAKLVIIINSALPGALIVIVLLKGKEEMADTAAAVAKVYLPSYLLSILTIAAWSAVGLWVTLPDDDGNTICQRR